MYCLLESGKHVRYIGITSQAIEVRLKQHFADCGRASNVYKENWLKSCQASGTPIDIHVIRSGLSLDQAGAIEVLLIQLLKRPFRLTNTHSGGSSGYAGLSEESRKKHKRNSMAGQVKSLVVEQQRIDLERGFCDLEEWNQLCEIEEGVK